MLIVGVQRGIISFMFLLVERTEFGSGTKDQGVEFDRSATVFLTPGER